MERDRDRDRNKRNEKEKQGEMNDTRYHRRAPRRLHPDSPKVKSEKAVSCKEWGWVPLCSLVPTLWPRCPQLGVTELGWGRNCIIFTNL